MKLKPCPFCGGTNLRETDKSLYIGIQRDGARSKYGHGVAYHVECLDCDASVSAFCCGRWRWYRDIRKEAYDKWNCRAPNKLEAMLQEISGELEKLSDDVDICAEWVSKV